MTLRSSILVLIISISTAFACIARDGVLENSNYSYKGGIEHGRQHGYGVCRYKNGSVYYGHWSHGFKDGLGRIAYPDGSIEFGTWKRGSLVKQPGQKFRPGAKAYGIDVAKYQKKVQWEKLALPAGADGKVLSTGKGGKFVQPVLFALIKSTEGTSIIDPMFARNFAEAKRCGIIRGAYHFLSVNSPVASQVKFFIANTPLEAGDLPPVLDLEISKEVMKRDHAKVVKMAKEWLKAIEKHYGVKPIIYTYNSYYLDYLKGKGLDDYDYWIARYGAEPSARHWEIWQFTEKGRVAGINHAVDIDLFRGSYGELLQYVKKKGVKKRR